MTEGASEQIRLQQLLALGETWVNSLAAVELDQQQRNAFVDRHRRRNKENFGKGRAVLVFQTRMGKMLGKLRFRWTGPYWIVAAEKRTFTFGTLAGEILPQKVNNPFEKRTDPTPPIAGPLCGESSLDGEPTT